MLKENDLIRRVIWPRLVDAGPDDVQVGQVVLSWDGMKILHLDPAASHETALVINEIDRLLGEGKHVLVTVAEESELLSPQQAADRLGFSRQHIVRLIGYGELEAAKLPGSSYWKIPLASVLSFEDRRAEGDRVASELSRDLDAMGAPLE